MMTGNERLKAIRQVIQEWRDAFVRGDFTAIVTARDTEALFLRLTRRDAAPGSASGVTGS